MYKSLPRYIGIESERSGDGNVIKKMISTARIGSVKEAILIMIQNNVAYEVFRFIVNVDNKFRYRVIH